jgi:hypothetical protein
MAGITNTITNNPILAKYLEELPLVVMPEYPEDIIAVLTSAVCDTVGENKGFCGNCGIRFLYDYIKRECVRQEAR